MPAFPAAKRQLTRMIPLLIFILIAPLALADTDDTGWLGVGFQSLSPAMAKALQLDDEKGVLVNNVIDDSPAHSAGLSAGDIIVDIDGKTIAERQDLVDVVQDLEPGTTVDIVVLRDGRQKTVEVEIGQREDNDKVLYQFFDSDALEHMEHDGDFQFYTYNTSDDDDVQTHFFSNHKDRGFLGVDIDDLSEQLGTYFQVEDGNGALITEVIEDTPAADAELKAGDVIVGLDDQEITSTQDLHNVMADVKPQQDVTLQIIRNGKRKQVDVTTTESPNRFGKDIEVLTDGKIWSNSTPKVLYYGNGHHLPKHKWTMPEGHDDEMDELRQEMKALKKELKSIRKELKK